MSSLPEYISRYKITKLLGEGAMGRVYLASDDVIRREVAIKTVRSDLQMSASKRKEYLERFAREARAAGRLTHPNIVAVYDVGSTEDGVPWIAMQYVDGKSFKEMRLEGYPVVANNILWIAKQVAAALDVAHEIGTVHRDIKPANILVSSKGEVKVTDFGIAHLADSDLTREGVMLGSPSYMSPEHVRGKDVGPASDFFSLAVILYEWIAGAKPFSGTDLASITHKIVYEEPDPISSHNRDFGAGLDQFFSKAMHKNAEKRLKNGTEFMQALEAALELDRQGDKVEVPEAVEGRNDDSFESTMQQKYVPDRTPQEEADSRSTSGLGSVNPVGVRRSNAAGIVNQSRQRQRPTPRPTKESNVVLWISITAGLTLLFALGYWLLGIE